MRTLREAPIERRDRQGAGEGAGERENGHSRERHTDEEATGGAAGSHDRLSPASSASST